MDELQRTETRDAGRPWTATELVGEQHWQSVEVKHEGGATQRHVVLDDFLSAEACTYVRSRIVCNKGWSFMNVNGTDRMLQIRNFDLPPVQTIANTLIEKLPRILSGLSLV